MIVISGALVVAALVLLVIGILDTNLPFVYASIGVSLASLLSLVVGILQRRGEELPGEAVQEREATSAQGDERTVPGTDAEQDRTDQLATILSQAPAAGSVRSGSRRLPPAGQPVTAHDDPRTDGAQGARAGDQDEDGDEAAHAAEAGQGADPYDEEGRYHQDAHDDGSYEDEGPCDELDDDQLDDGLHDDRGDVEGAVDQQDDQQDDEGHDDEGSDDEGSDDEGWDNTSGAPGLTSDATVLVVDGRPRYHLADCRYLIGKDAQVIGLHDAREIGFSSCGVCKPDSVLEQSAPEPPAEAPPSDEAEADGPSRIRAEDRLPAGHDEQESSFEAILFGEPVSSAPDGEQRPPAAAASGQWQHDQQDGADWDDDTQALEVVAVDDEASEAPAPGEVEEQPDEDDESEDGRQGEPAQADLPAEALSDATPDEPEAQDRRAATAGAAQRESVGAAPTGPHGTTTDVDDAFVDRTLTVPPSVWDEPAAGGAAPASTDGAAGTPAAGQPAAPPMMADESAATAVETEAAATDQAPAAMEAAAQKAAKKAPAKRAPAKRAPAKKAPAKKAPTKAAATKATATKAPAKAAAKTAPPTKAAAGERQTAEAPASRAAGKRAPAGSSGSKAPAAADLGGTTTPVERTAAVRAAAPPPSSTGSARPAAVTIRAAAPKLPAGRLRTAPGRTAVVAAPRVAAAPVRPGAASSASQAASGRTSGQVVVIPDGGKFHRSTCRYVRDEPAAEPLSAARAVEQGYAPCGVCKP